MSDGYGPNRGACGSSCGCNVVTTDCPALDGRAEFAGNAYSYDPQAELDAADRAARW